MGYSGPLLCRDCGVDTYGAIDREWYHVHNEAWESAGLAVNGSGFLCIGCLESRMGRKLVPSDFDGYDPDPRDSRRLRNRRDG
jgi:hypothetical protein